MKAIRIANYGGPEVMSYTETPEPPVTEKEVLVKITSSGVNFIDVYHRTGLYEVKLPYTLGLEAAGTVVETGSEVRDYKKSDRVAFCLVPGAYAEYVAVPAHRLVRIPKELDFQTAAAVMLQGMTAHYLIRDTFALSEGTRCLVHAAAGGVGLLLIQMAKLVGAWVIGTVSTEEKAQLAKEAGADETILYTEQDFESETKRLTAGAGVGVVYDSVGKDTFEKSLNCLVPKGMLVLYGQSSGPVPSFDPTILNRKGSLFLTRPSLFHYIAERADLERRAAELFNWIVAGQLKVRIDQTFSLSQAAEAHRYLEARRSKGKILLAV